MATQFIFGGRTRKLPGVYSRITSGRDNPPLDLSYGNVLIVDINGDIPGGAGINGTNTSGKDAIYTFRSLANFRDFAFSGLWNKAGEYLFRPNGADVGASAVLVVKPFTTTPADMTFTATGGGSAGGTFKIVTLDESTGANGVLDGTDLKSGYAYTIETGVINSSKFIFKIWRGGYKGDSTNYISPVVPFDEIELSSHLANPQLIVQSPEFDNIQDLIDWAEGDEEFAKNFKLDSSASSVTGAGTVDSDDVTRVSGYNLAINGAQTANSTDLTDALNAVADINYNFVIAWDDTTAPESSTDVLKVKAFVETQSEYNPDLYTTMALGGEDSQSGAIASTASLNSDRVVLNYQSVKKTSQLSNTSRVTLHPIFATAFIVGRTAGLEPQVPNTKKRIDINGLVDNPTKLEQETLLDAGVLALKYDNTVEGFTILQGVNTLQNNKYVLNGDGTSHVIQFRRIAAQLNAELKVNINRNLLSDPNGVNRNTLSSSTLKSYIEGYLQRKVATTTDDNLIISYRNVVVERDQDAYFATYEFVPNSEIRIVFVTGFAI